jgi:hypothetical protein
MYLENYGTEEDRPTVPQFRAMQYNLNTSVADPGCLSQIPDPDFSPSRIPDSKTATKVVGEKNLLLYLLI